MVKHINLARAYETQSYAPACFFKPPYLASEFVSTYRESDCTECRQRVERIKTTLDAIMEVKNV